MSSKYEANDLASGRWRLFPGAMIGVRLAALLVGIWLASGGGGAPTPLAGRGEWLAVAWRWWSSSSSSSSHFSSSWALFPLWSLVFTLVFFVFFFALPWFSWGLSAARAGMLDNGVRHRAIRTVAGDAETALRRGRRHETAVRAYDERPRWDTVTRQRGLRGRAFDVLSLPRVTLEVTARISSGTSCERS
jgi:hypothetical protein